MKWLLYHILSFLVITSPLLRAQQLAEAVKQDTSPVLRDGAKPTDEAPDSGVITPKSKVIILPSSGSVSSSTAAMVIGGLPKYSPPKPPLPEKTLAEEFPDLRDVDKPKNKIIRLPRYMVRAPKSPILTEREILTDAQKTALAMKKYAGLGRLPLNARIAKQLYQQDERLQNMADLKDIAGAVKSGGDSTEGAYILRQSQDTYMNGLDWGGTIPKP